MRALLIFSSVCAFLSASSARAETFICDVETKIDFLGGIVYTEQQLRDLQFRVVLNTSSKSVSRCSFSESVGLVTCDKYQIDREEKAIGLVEIAKYYYFLGQFDLQIFGSGQFIENNGRGTIATGFCN